MESREESLDLSADDRRALAAEVGQERAAALDLLVERLRTIAPGLDAWLAEDLDHRSRFEADPVATLAAEFPELELPEPFRSGGGRASPLSPGERSRFRLPVPPPGASPEALDLFEAFCAWVAGAAANEASYRADAFAALRAFAAASGATAPVLDEVARALERVRNIWHLLPDQPFAWLREPAVRRAPR